MLNTGSQYFPNVVINFYFPDCSTLVIKVLGKFLYSFLRHNFPVSLNSFCMINAIQITYLPVSIHREQ